jgi:hypothetical protein
MNGWRDVQDLGELLLIVTAVWTLLIGGGIGLFWLLGWLLGAG